MQRFRTQIRFCATLLCSACSVLIFAQTQGQNGMVVSDHKLASQVGIDILKRGGNAIDASVATALTLSVTHPQAGNIGGGGFLVFMDSNGIPTTIDFREKAPFAATADMFLDSEGNLIPGANHWGLKSVGVPGTVAGLYLAHQKYGELPWADLVQPAIDLAENGFPLSWTLYNHGQSIKNWPADSDLIHALFKDVDGNYVQAGQKWKQPALTETLAQIRDHGRDGFYKGKVASILVQYMKDNGGIITQEDLIKYEAIERKPMHGTFKGFDIYAMGPPSSGGIALIEMLNMIEAAEMDSVEFNSTAYVHLLAEVMRRAFADRAEFLGDPDFNTDMPLDQLTDKGFAKMRVENIDVIHASPSDSSRFGQIYEGDHTTHFSVIDKDGNAVSLTYTLEQSYGSGMGSSELGFLLNNEMGDFNPQPGYTNNGWLIGTPANTIAPGKRMLSSMCPTIIANDGKPYLVIGSPGGRTIINTVFQTVLCVLEYDMPVDKAIEAMKIHHQWLPNELKYERDLLSPDTRESLEKMGHTMIPVDNLGRLMGISIDSEKFMYTGASDSSSPDGAAVGY